MNQYINKTFSRGYLQWAKCVINYLIDAFQPDVLYLILFLFEVI